VCKKIVKKFPTVWEKMSENLRGGIFDSHCTHIGKVVIKVCKVSR